MSVQTLEFDTSDNHGDHTIVSYMDAPDRASILHTVPLNLTFLQVGGVCVADEIGSERAGQLLKATQLRHNRMEERGLLDSKLQAVPQRNSGKES